MEERKQLIYDTKRLMLARYPRFASEISSANIEYRTDLKYHTAATDGKNIYFDPDYLASLSESDRLFLIAHELLHIKFAHMFRLKDESGKKRNLDIWNEATDAIINANLQRDGFKIKKGYVNRSDALEYSAEELYDILLKERENQNSDNSGQNNSDENEIGESQESSSNNQSSIGDDHSLWEEAFEKMNKSDNDQESPSDKKDESSSSNEIPVDKFDEREEFSRNREERRAKAKENLERMKEQMLKDFENDKSFQSFNLGDVGESKESIDWKVLLRREIEKSETIWSNRRSIAENNYAYRLEEYDTEDDAETEVMIDVSGSVDLDLVKAFLRTLKPLLKHSKLKVGCFNEKFWGMLEINSKNDIDNFVIPEGARGRSAWTEDWDLAVRSFTKKKEVNKIVFTDGYPQPGTMPKEDLRRETVIWLVYGNKNFHPCCGKVINITEEQLERLCFMEEEVKRHR